MTFSKFERWSQRVECIDFAFQPIVNIFTGVCFGYEALLRRYDHAGFDTIGAFFEKAYQDDVLHQVDLMLRERAIEKFSKLEKCHGMKLFYNIDNRVLSPQTYRQGATRKILEKFSLHQDNLCFEISEKFELINPQDTLSVLDVYRTQNYKIAMDDYGAGFSGLQMLYFSEPDFIKIDGFFIRGIENDPKKKLFVTSIVNIAHLLGSIVIAESVETAAEYFQCKEIGCDLIQGYLIQRPEIELMKLKSRYRHIYDLNRKDRRKKVSRDLKLINTKIEYIDPISHRKDIYAVFQQFKQQNHSFLPIVNDNNEPLGVVREKSFKNYAYSRYGSELLQNPGISRRIHRFISKFPIADINTSAEKILQIYSQNESIEGILMVENMKYVGFLSTHALLTILNEKNLAIARDQNPLTRLPGNNLIYEFVSEALHDTENQYIFVYLDFDNFKPYNDTFGFRNGDRVILLFADLLTKHVRIFGGFAGHIGGDDFFLGFKHRDTREVSREISRLVKKFQGDVEGFYDSDTIKKGFIVAKDRKGQMTQFPLLTVSAVVMELPSDQRQAHTIEEVGSCLARLKKQAKISDDKIYVLDISDIENHSTNRDEPEMIKSPSINGHFLRYETTAGYLSGMQMYCDPQEPNMTRF